MRLAVGSARTWDAWLWLAAVGLVLVSALAVTSATATITPSLAARHAVWIVLGLMVGLGASRMRAHAWLDLGWAAYGISLILLALVPVAGAMRLGATRWLSVFGLSLQPSELAKLTTVWVLARYLAGHPSPLPGRAVVVSSVLAGLPALLIFLQPDLGSASVLVAIWLGMVGVAGMSRRSLAFILAGVLAGVPLGWHALHGYQRDRLLAFLNPHADPLGTGYTIIQSTIAIGSGRLWGRGYFAGTQNQLNFLPERHSDFIFSVIGEEWGFLGCVAVVVLFGFLLVRMSRIALEAPVPEGRFLAAGVLAWVGVQAFVNMGMVMGLLPVVGVPLPLVSYGGSSMVTVWLALGLLQSLHRLR